MFCKNCGKKISDDSVFCGYCGAKVTWPATSQPEDALSEDKLPEDGLREDKLPEDDPREDELHEDKLAEEDLHEDELHEDKLPEDKLPAGDLSKGSEREAGDTTPKAGGVKAPAGNAKKNLYLGFAVIAAAVLVVLGLIRMLAGSGFGRSATEIDLNNYMGVSYQGYDGYGTAQCEFYYQDYQNSIEQALSESGILESDNLDGQQRVLIDQLFEMPFTYSIDKDACLHNGDKVSVAFNIKDTSFEDIGIKLKGDTKSYEVSGLDPTQEADPFEGFAIDYSGTAPYCTASWHGGLRELTYTLSSTENLKLGDTITVTVDYLGNSDFSEFTQKTGLELSRTEEVFTVENVDTYCLSISDISDEIKGKMDKVAQDSMTSIVARWDTPSSYKGMDHLGYYYLIPKYKDFWGTPYFYLYSIYKVNVVEESGNIFSYYTFWRFENPMILANGTCTCNLDNNKRCGNMISSNGLWYDGYTTLEGIFNDCVSKNVSEYEYEDTVQENQSAPAQTESDSSDSSEGATSAEVAE